MIAFDLNSYQPRDTLYLWWLANPQAPRLIGELRMARALNGVSLEYAPANVALKAAGEELGYPELAQWLRRRADTAAGGHLAQMQELFRRMVFNILIDNTDDHEKNHALLMADSGAFALSPAFDVLPSGQALGYQQMRVGSAGADSTLNNALSECAQFGLKKHEARQEIKKVCDAVGRWQLHFAQLGVGRADIDALACQIDRTFLLSQRQTALA